MSLPILFDIETDGLLPELTRVHVIVLGEVPSKGDVKWKVYHDEPEVAERAGTIAEALQILQDAPALIGHNILSFDLPALSKVYPQFSYSGRVWDTVVMSRFAYSDRKERDFALVKAGKLPGNMVGQHSLASWGARLGYAKGEWSDWSCLSEGMIEYCVRDCEVNVRLARILLAECRRPDITLAGGIEMEHEFAQILEDIERNGARLDMKAAEDLLARLVARKAELEQEIHEVFPPLEVPYKIRKDNGKRTRMFCPVRKGMYDNKLVPFEPNSRQMLAARLQLQRSWIPRELSQKTLKPAMHEQVLLELAEVYPEVQKVMEYYIVRARIGMLETGKSSYLSLADEDGYIHGRVMHIGTVTHRCSHSRPNLGNVTAKGKPYGEEMRRLFIPRPGMIQAGADADGLELCMLGHYLSAYDGGAYIQALMKGNKADGTDPHSIHAQAISTVHPVSRDGGKPITYAFLYGAGDAKLGAMVDGDVTKGKKVRAALLRHVNGLGPLVKELQKRVRQSGNLYPFRERRVGIRSPHSALNTLLQTSGAICMKYFTVYLVEELGNRAILSGHIHDEVQSSILVQDKQAFSDAVRLAGERTTEHLGVAIPLTFSAKFGTNWADTH